jgi:hypothetical protein
MKDAASEKKKQTTGATSSGVSPERNFSKIGLSKFVTAASRLGQGLVQEHRGAH